MTSFVVAILVNFCCFTSPFAPDFEAKCLLPEMTIKDRDIFMVKPAGELVERIQNIH